ncbi:hypothetical protein EBB59_12750 [Lysobacter pythonis]|uniref:Uncharacterized protein n=1 Tax=Solilutibacter pythonis TaxID=2483112 RepID=A0A3M2HD30_9GAMM|nr:hypothetical protein [Lysobacter pythonis]RMH87601.1 hypothetical protein EBB59_12750 [Lysobacter pythonis]
MDGYWFTSSLFLVEPGRDGEVNPGSCGRQLAAWLKKKLEWRGYNVEPIITEDWGYCLMLSRDPFLLWVGCGYAEDSVADDPTNGEITWHCFSVVEIPFIKRLFGKPDTSAALSRLDADLWAILSAEPAITLEMIP